jgi:MFS family permease
MGAARTARLSNNKNTASGGDMSGPTEGAAQPAARAPSTGYSVWVLAMLFIVYAFNFLDRQIISILAIPIQEELGLSDRQLGLLGGIAFAFLYSTLGVPIAWLADRTNRTWIITISLTVWSGFTALCGFAQNFWQLFLSRVGVGVGEAGGVAPSYSLIADYFPPNSRARALAIYSLGIPIGSAFGVIAGAQIAGGALGDNLDWRTAFIIVGLAGIVIAPLFKFTVREPVRGGLDAKPQDADSGMAAEAEAAGGEPVASGASQADDPVLRPGPGASIAAALARLIDFSGRSRRSEFWWFTLALLGVTLVLFIVGTLISSLSVLATIAPAVMLLALPAAVRRTHDLGKSAMVMLLPLIVTAAGFVVANTAGEAVLFSLAGAVVSIVGLVMLALILIQASDADNAFGARLLPDGYDSAMRKKASPGFVDVLAILSGKRSFFLLVLGASCSSMMGYGVFFWVPSFFARSFQLDIITTGWFFGGVLLVGGTLGILLGGVLGDLMGKGSKRMFAIVPAVAFLLTFPMYVAGTLSPTAIIGALLFIIPTGLGLAWLGPTLSAFQHLAPPNMRSMASSVFLLVNNLLGIGVGVYVLGELSTLMTPIFGDEALRYSIMIGASLYLVAGLLFLLASRTIAKDWEDS